MSIEKSTDFYHFRFLGQSLKKKLQRINPKSTENIFLLSPSQIFYKIKLKLNEVVFNVLHNCHSLTMNLFNSLEYLIVYLTTGILYQIYQILTITSKKSLKYVI